MVVCPGCQREIGTSRPSCIYCGHDVAELRAHAGTDAGLSSDAGADGAWAVVLAPELDGEARDATLLADALGLSVFETQQLLRRPVPYALDCRTEDHARELAQRIERCGFDAIVYAQREVDAVPAARIVTAVTVLDAHAGLDRSPYRAGAGPRRMVVTVRGGDRFEITASQVRLIAVGELRIRRRRVAFTIGSGSRAARELQRALEQPLGEGTSTTDRRMLVDLYWDPGNADVAPLRLASNTTTVAGLGVRNYERTAGLGRLLVWLRRSAPNAPVDQAHKFDSQRRGSRAPELFGRPREAVGPVVGAGLGHGAWAPRLRQARSAGGRRPSVSESGAPSPTVRRPSSRNRCRESGTPRALPRSMHRFIAGMSLLLVFIAAAPASAHLHLDEPVNRYGDTQKAPPCGMDGGLPSDMVTVYEPGETITIRFRETVNHPSHYRVSFSPNGDQDFVDPATMDELYSNEFVLLDNIPDVAEPAYAIEVTLPEVECETCVLQVIQVMYDKPPYTIPGNDIYYNCADIALRAGGGTPDEAGDDTGEPGDDTGEPGDDTGAPAPGTGDASGQLGGGCAVAQQGAPGLPALLIVGLGWFATRRRRR